MSSSPRTTRLLHVTTVPMTLRFLRGQVGHMKSLGYEVDIASSPGPELQSFSEQEGLVVHPVAMERRIAPLRDIVSLAKLWRVIRRFDPDIVHSHTPKGGLLGMCAARVAGVPIRCYHLRGLPMMGMSGSKRGLLRWTERISCSLASEVFCVSHSLRELAISEGLCSPEKVHVLAGGSGNGVDSSGQYNPFQRPRGERTATRSRLGISPDSLVIGFVGRLVRDKGIIELEAAWQSIRESHPSTVLLLIGPPEEGDPVPAEVLARLANDPRVRSVGMVATAAPYYSTMDLLVLPTYREGFPNVLLEAASMELPTIATRVTGCVDAIDNEKTGLLVNPRDGEALAKAMKRYLDSQELRQAHGCAGRKRVIEQFAPEQIWMELAEHYLALKQAHQSQSARKIPPDEKRRSGAP